MSSSRTGGYLTPASYTPPQPGVSLNEFIQLVFVGLSGLKGQLVRPDWQQSPPKQPDIDTDWMAYGIAGIKPEGYSYVGYDPGVSKVVTARFERLEIQCSFYGPRSLEYCEIVRDGFQLTQNVAALTAAKMGFTETSDAIHAPDLVNERWVDRYMMSVFLQRMVQRTYQISTFVSVSGLITVNNAGDQVTTEPFNVEP